MIRLCAEQAAEAASSAHHRAAEIAEQLKALREGNAPNQASVDQARRLSRDTRVQLTLARRTAILIHYEAAMTSATAARRLESRGAFVQAIPHWERAEDRETSAFAEFDAVSPATDPSAKEN